MQSFTCKFHVLSCESHLFDWASPVCSWSVWSCIPRKLPVWHYYLHYMLFFHTNIHFWCIFVGLQQGVISSAEPYGLPLNETILPQYLKQFGYASHIVGKVCNTSVNLCKYYISSILHIIIDEFISTPSSNLQKLVHRSCLLRNRKDIWPVKVPSPTFPTGSPLEI